MKTMQAKRAFQLIQGGLWGDEAVGASDDIAVVRVADFQYEGLTAGEAPTRRVVPRHLLEPRLLEPGDLLLEKSGGGNQQNVGRVVEWTGADQAICSNFINMLRPAPGFNSRWLVYIHRWLYVTGRANVCTKQTTGIQNVDLLAYLASPIPSVSYEVQSSIAHFLDRESERIADLGQRLGRTRVLGDEAERALIDQVFEDEPVARLGWMADIQSGLTLGKDYRGSETVEYPYLRVANVQQDRIDIDQMAMVSVPQVVAEKVSLRAGDVLMTEGGDIDKLGRGAVWRGEVDPCLHQNHVFAVRCREPLLPDTLALWTRSSSARMYFERTASRITNIASTNTTKLRALPAPSLSADRQRELLRVFADGTEPLASLRAAAQRMERLLAFYADALITEAVTGQLDVTRVSESQMDERAHAAAEWRLAEIPSASASV